jgi:zinc protease
MTSHRLYGTVLSALLLVSFASGVKVKDPRDLTFPTRLAFTPQTVERRKLSNGIEVFLVEDHELPLVDVTVFIQAGERRVPATKAGVAEVLADVISEGGSKAVASRLFADSLRKLGASFGANAWSEGASFRLNLLSEHLEDLLPLVSGAIREPALPEAQLDLNKQQYLSNYNSRNLEPDDVANRVFSKLVSGQESPAAREITPATLKQINRKLISDFHASNYRPSLAMIGVSGDFNPDTMLELLERCFGNWKEPKSEPWEKEPLIDAGAPAGVYLVQWPGAVQSQIFMGYHGIDRDDPAYSASRLLSLIFGGKDFSRLNREVREKRGLAYLVTGFISSGFEHEGMMEAICMTKSQSTVEAAEVMTGIIRDLKNKGVSDDELKRARDNWFASFPAYYEDPRAVLSDKMTYALHGYPIDFWDRMPEKVEPVTTADVNAFAARFMNADSLVILVLGDTASFDGSLSKLGKVTVIDPEKY